MTRAYHIEVDYFGQAPTEIFGFEADSIPGAIKHLHQWLLDHGYVKGTSYPDQPSRWICLWDTDENLAISPSREGVVRNKFRHPWFAVEPSSIYTDMPPRGVQYVVGTTI